MGHKLGVCLSEETKRKIGDATRNRTVDVKKKHADAVSKALKGKKRSEETKNKIRVTLSGHLVSDETREKISKSKMGCVSPRRGAHQSDETKEKCRLASTGKRHTEESKRKMSASHMGHRGTLGRKQSKEEIEKRRAKLIGHVTSEETKRKISIAHIGKPQSVEHRRKVTIINRERKEKHPEIILKMIEGKIGGFWYGNIRYTDGVIYCEKFDETFKERVRAFRGRVCFECGAPENGKKLAIHHVHYNKKMCCDGSPRDVIPLCAACHAKTNWDRDFWEKHFTEKIYNLDPNGKCFFTKEEMKIFKESNVNRAWL